jgi:hypothetical protein
VGYLERQQLASDGLHEAVVELPALLQRSEADEVAAALAQLLREGEAVVATGADFSGRRWYRLRTRVTTLRKIASEFYSVDAIHPALHTDLAASKTPARKASQTRAEDRPTSFTAHLLPTVGSLDTGVPSDHPELTPALRRGTYIAPEAPLPSIGDHGTFVSSRAVFGELDMQDEDHFAARAPTCRFYDLMIAIDERRIDDKSVYPAIDAVVRTAPDVRVFNLSFASPRSLSSYDEIERRERLALVQDLDNLIFAHDLVVTVAAGNSLPGVVPNSPYPQHFEDADWGLSAWPSGFNTLTCGSLVGSGHPEGIALESGWPSPFTRAGPGIAGAPTPDFGAAGGNVNALWRPSPGMGVWGCTAAGLWEDRVGTSFASPIVARTAAWVLQELQRWCAPGARPFGVTARAYLTLTAELPPLPGSAAAYAARTIGRGQVSDVRLRQARPSTAVVIWQGLISGKSDLVRVQLPVPRNWLAEAKQPALRIVCCWDPPVNATALHVWTCRKVTLQLKRTPGGRTIRLKARSSAGVYPVIDRVYDLSADKIADFEAGDDLWSVELSYEELAEYPVGAEFSPQQRVAFAAELFDADVRGSSPQDALQALPIAATMNRLAVTSVPVPIPVVLRRG